MAENKEHGPLHPDDELYEQARYRDFAHEVVEFRFPDLEGEEKKQKVAEIARAAEAFDRAQILYFLPKFDESE